MDLAHELMNAKAKERLIVAVDVDSAQKAKMLMDELAGSVGAFKIGLQLFTAAGPDLVRWATNAGHRIFLDLKFHDIPQTVAMASVEAARLGVWMFNVHALGGREMMQRTAAEVSETCQREKLVKPKIIAVTILTSSSANGLVEVGIERSVGQEVSTLAQMASESGLDGVVASAHEARSIKQSSQTADLLVVTPGIRPAFGTRDDQKRVMTPSEAISNGSDYLVIGRPITGSSNRLTAVHELMDEISASFPVI